MPPSENARSGYESNPVRRAWTFTVNNYAEKDTKFFDNIEVKYICYGKEVGDSGTPHLQGFIIFKRGYRLTALKKLHSTAHWEAAKTADAMNYCMKDGDFTVRDNRSQGKRNDFAEAAAIIKEHKTKRSMLNDPRLYRTMAMHGRWATQMIASRAPATVAVPHFRTWQQSLMDLVKTSPHPRKVHWWWDETGGSGKSFMTNLLVRNHDAFLAGGKKVDCLYAYKEHLATVIIFDLTRSQMGEFCPYSTMETLKDGRYLSTKYESVMVCRDEPAHLLVFANSPPDRSKMSEDRWDVHHIAFA